MNKHQKTLIDWWRQDIKRKNIYHFAIGNQVNKNRVCVCAMCINPKKNIAKKMGGKGHNLIG